MTNKSKVKLRSYDELFSASNPEASTKNKIKTVPIDKLIPFSNHPFRPYKGERLEDMVASIKANGVIVPIIARVSGEKIEIIAGHNRVNAAMLAGMNEVPAIVLEDISDETAMAYAIETNLVQRSFTDMSHSEKAAAISLHYSKMFSQGKRNDILEQLKTLENDPTSSQVETKFRSDEKVGAVYNLSRSTIARYIRIQHLIHPLKERLDAGTIPFIPAVNLSFLSDDEQALVESCLDERGFFVDIKKAEALRQVSDYNKLDRECITSILEGVANDVPERFPVIKISREICEKYFKHGQSPKEIKATIEKALELYFSLEKDF